MSTRKEPTPPESDGAPTETPAPGQAGQPPEADARRRPTGWIVLAGVLALAVVGLAIWAFSAQSDADDAQATLDAQTSTTETTPQPTEADAEAQQEFEQVQEDLGATTESLDQIEQDLDQAAAKVDEAEQAQGEATGALDTAKAAAESARAQSELTQTCLRGTLNAVGAAFESGGLEAAVQELQKLSGSCGSAASS
jgi:Skp family chaperone for outer membrane proteins